MLNPRKKMGRKAPEEAGFDHPVVFPRRLRAACFSAIGVTTAAALIIVGLFANVGLSFLPVPGLGLPNAPKTSAVGSGHALSATGGDGGSVGGLVSAGGVAFAPVTVPGGTVATESSPTFSTTAGDPTPTSSGQAPTHVGAAAGIGKSTSVDADSKATGENGKSTGGNGKPGGNGSSTSTTPATTPPAPATAPTEEATAVLTATGASGSGEGTEPGSGESSESAAGGRPGKSTSTTKPGENEGEAAEETPVEEAPAGEPPAEPPLEEPVVEAPEPGEGEPETEPEPPAETTELPAETPAPVEEVPADPGETPPVPAAE